MLLWEPNQLEHCTTHHPVIDYFHVASVFRSLVAIGIAKKGVLVFFFLAYAIAIESIITQNNPFLLVLC